MFRIVRYSVPASPSVLRNHTSSLTDVRRLRRVFSNSWALSNRSGADVGLEDRVFEYLALGVAASESGQMVDESVEVVGGIVVCAVRECVYPPGEGRHDLCGERVAVGGEVVES